MVNKLKTGWMMVEGIRFKWTEVPSGYWTFGETSSTLSGLRNKIFRKLVSAGISKDTIKRDVKK